MTEEEVNEIIESTFDEVAKEYDINDYFLITAKKMIDDISYEKDLKILDLSCGTGNTTILLAKKFNDSHITAVDLSASMIKEAKEKAKKVSLDNITFKKADVNELTFEENTFDIITCGFGLFFYPNMENSFKNFIKMLKEDGTFIFSSFSKEAFTPYATLFEETLDKSFNLKYPKGGKNFLETDEEIKELISSLDKVKYETKKINISKNISVETWWDILNSAGYKGMLNQLSKKDLKRFKVEHLEEISTFSNNGKIELQTNTLITKVEKDI